MKPDLDIVSNLGEILRANLDFETLVESFQKIDLKVRTAIYILGITPGSLDQLDGYENKNLKHKWWIAAF